VDPIIARKTWRTAEVIHGMVYFAPEAQERYVALGLSDERVADSGAGAPDASPVLRMPGRMGYFASRGAALGPVSSEVIVATFFNFNSELVRAAIPEAWRIADPSEILGARLEAADATLRRALGDKIHGPEVAEAARLARRAAEAANEHPQGRPLFAAHAALAWPDEPHLVLWHAQTLLREFRGDGHVAALLIEGLTGVEALVIHAATGEVGASVLQDSRGWPDTEWNAAAERMRSRSLVGSSSELSLTEGGRAHRQWVEDRTDLLALPAYEALGEEGCARFRELARPLSSAILEAGLLPLGGSNPRS
jgi:hypothetical protein